MSAPQLALIADDLTGALDSGVQLRKSGLSVMVCLTAPRNRESAWAVHGADVVCLSTDSRADPAPVAASKVERAGLLVRGIPIYKKIDSALRGNLGAELEALLQVAGIQRAIIAPAFPAQGRTTVAGRQFIEGRPVSETAFARDPVSPVQESSIVRALATQSWLPAELVPLPVVARGASAVAESIASSQAAFLVCDATSDEHLAGIAAGAVRAGAAALLCGSAGLAGAVPMALGLAAAGRSESLPLPSGPLLIVNGSRHPVTARQVDCLVMERAVVPAATLMEPGANRQLAGRLANLLSRGQDTALVIAEGDIIAGASAVIAVGLAALVASAIKEARPAGLIITGGDIAVAVCDALGAQALRLETEVLAGIPLSTLFDGPYSGLPIVTKAGGFGTPDSLKNIVSWWQRQGGGAK